MSTATDRIKRIQQILREAGTYKGKIDGDFGRLSRAGLEALIASAKGASGHDAVASSFADPADIKAFKKCKLTGKTDKECFKVGDNGIGYWELGELNTAQEHTPMCALTKADLTDSFGSVGAAKGRYIDVTVGSKTVRCLVDDILGVAGRCDLNPAAAAALGLEPPFLRDCKWRVVEK